MKLKITRLKIKIVHRLRYHRFIDTRCMCNCGCNSIATVYPFVNINAPYYGCAYCNWEH